MSQTTQIFGRIALACSLTALGGAPALAMPQISNEERAKIISANEEPSREPNYKRGIFFGAVIGALVAAGIIKAGNDLFDLPDEKKEPTS